jgi:hypothetical protein
VFTGYCHDPELYRLEKDTTDAKRGLWSLPEGRAWRPGNGGLYHVELCGFSLAFGVPMALNRASWNVCTSSRRQHPNPCTAAG